MTSIPRRNHKGTISNFYTQRRENLVRKMYVTRPLSTYQRDPSALSIPPPGGPNSGVLVIQDEEAQPTCCFELCKSNKVKDLPFPQNKNLKVEYTTQTGDSQHVSVNRVLFIPVVNQPLSSNQYYVIKRSGRQKGEAYTSSKEEDMTTCCFCSIISDLEPQRLDPENINQQFEIRHRSSGGYVAKSVAPDGFPPNFLRRKGWRVYTSTSSEYELDEAAGLDQSLRAQLPGLNFPISQKSSAPVVVGKWYTPFMFVRERTPEDQMKSSVYYKITLEQQWDQIFACERDADKNNAVNVDIVVDSEVVKVGGREGVSRKKSVVDGMMWFENVGPGEASVGLSLAIVERMKWEQERGGWDGSEGQVIVKRVEKYEGSGEWRRFGCYVLVERFVFKRMDGSLLLTYDFRHAHQIKSKWE